MVDSSIAELEARLAAASVAPIDAVARIDALNALSWALRFGDASRAHALASEARELARTQHYALGQARAARTMAMTLDDSELPRVIFQLAEEAKQLFDDAGDPAGRAGARDFLASLREHTGDLAGGLELALDALSIARELGDPIRQGYALSSVGGILAASGETDTAVARLEEALALFRGADDLAGVGTICSRLAKVLRSAGRHDEALGYADECRVIAKLTDDEYLDWTAFTVQAEIAEEEGRLQQAEELYRTALDRLPEHIGRNVLGAQTQVALGRLLTRSGALDAAEGELKDALRRIEGDSVSAVTEAGVCEALAELYERRGELSATIDQLRRAQALREHVARREARNKLAQVEVRAAMEAARRDAEIQKLRFVELRSMQAKLVEAEKMALLGKLAAGTAHELNTPLGVLRSNAQLSATATDRLLSRFSRDGDGDAQVVKLRAMIASCRNSSDVAIERVAAIARSFTRFTQLDQAERRTFDLAEGVDSAIALLEPTIPDAISVERNYAPVLPIDGWPRELNHALLTVLQNAVQAIEGAGVVSVETSATQDQVLLRIRDSGRGMSAEQAAHLFDVTFSEEGRTRMRLGLSAAYTTMQKHGGTIDVDSTLGEGTTVTFRFPRRR